MVSGSNVLIRRGPRDLTSVHPIHVGRALSLRYLQCSNR